MNAIKLNDLLKKSGDAVAIIPLTHIELPKHLSKKSALFEDFPKSQILQKTEFSKLLEGRNQVGIINTLGTLEVNFLNNTYIAMLPMKGISLESNVAMDSLNDINALIKNFISNLWHFRDNNVNSDAGYLFVDVGGQPIVHKNDMRMHFYDAHGNVSASTTFNYREIHSAAQMASKSAQHFMEEAKLSHKKPTSRVKGGSRIDRFMTWVMDARQQNDVLTKVAIYITALEALLSTSNAELSHQLSERVALLNPVKGAQPPKEAFAKMKRLTAFVRKPFMATQ